MSGRTSRRLLALHRTLEWLDQHGQSRRADDIEDAVDSVKQDADSLRQRLRYAESLLGYRIEREMIKDWRPWVKWDKK
jgi:hypothetical protein